MLKVILPIIAVVGLGVAAYVVYESRNTVAPAEPITSPATTPYDASLAGSGVIEASSSNIEVSTQLPGLIETVAVDVGDKVRKGDPLVYLEDRHLKAQEQLDRTDLEVAQAVVEEGKAQLADMQARLQLAEKIKDKRAISVDDLDRRRYAVQAAEAKLLSERARVKKARAKLEQSLVDIDRMVIRAPINGEVLQVNADPGEYAMAGANEPLIVMGATSTLRVRVDVDEHDAWRFKKGSKATGILRGNPEIVLDLTFRKIEPLIVPRRQLSGDTEQRVDQRVLQVIYTFHPGDKPVYIGQQVDVWIEEEQ